MTHLAASRAAARRWRGVLAHATALCGGGGASARCLVVGLAPLAVSTVARLVAAAAALLRVVVGVASSLRLLAGPLLLTGVRCHSAMFQNYF